MTRILVKARRTKEEQERLDAKRREALEAIVPSKSEEIEEETPPEEAPPEEAPPEEASPSLMEQLTAALQNATPEQLKEALSQVGSQMEEQKERQDMPKFRGGKSKFDREELQRRRGKLPGTTMPTGKGHQIRIREKREKKVDPETGKETFKPTGETQVVGRGGEVNILSNIGLQQRKRKEARELAQEKARRTRELRRDDLREDKHFQYTFDNPKIGHMGGAPIEGTDFSELGGGAAGGMGSEGDFPFSADRNYNPKFPLLDTLFRQKMKNPETGKWEMSDEFQRHNSLSNILQAMILHHPQEAEDWLQIPDLANWGRATQNMSNKERRQALPLLVDAMKSALKNDPDALAEHGMRFVDPEHKIKFAGEGGISGPSINLQYIQHMMNPPEMSAEERELMEWDKRTTRLLGMAADMNIPDSHHDEFIDQINELTSTGMNEETAAEMVASDLHSEGFEQDIYSDPSVWERPSGAPSAGGVRPSTYVEPEEEVPDKPPSDAKLRAHQIRQARQQARQQAQGSEGGGMTLGDFMPEGMGQPHLASGATEGPPVPPIPEKKDDEDQIETSEDTYESLGDRLLKSILEDMWQRT